MTTSSGDLPMSQRVMLGWFLRDDEALVLGARRGLDEDATVGVGEGMVVEGHLDGGVIGWAASLVRTAALRWQRGPLAGAKERPEMVNCVCAGSYAT